MGKAAMGEVGFNLLRRVSSKANKREGTWERERERFWFWFWFWKRRKGEGKEEELRSEESQVAGEEREKGGFLETRKTERERWFFFFELGDDVIQR